MDRKTLAFLASVLLSLLTISIPVLAQTQGHPVSQLRPGTFGSGNFVFPDNLTVGSNYLFVDSFSGRVGIGTASPTTMLDVRGDIFSNGTIRSNLTHPSYDAMDDGLVLYIPFSEGSGGTLYDRSKYGNNGIIKGTTWEEKGKFGYAMYFVGDDGYVDVDSLDGYFDGKEQCTLSAWVKFNSTKDDMMIVGTWWTGAMALNSDDGNVEFKLDTDSSSLWDAVSTSLLNDSNWHHVAGVYNGSHQMLYVDGFLDDIDQKTGNISASSNFNIGNTNDFGGSTYTWNGTIDEVMVFDRALNSDEIMTYYKKGLGTSAPYVDLSGNVGIGTTSPDELLHLESSAGDKPVLKIENINADDSPPAIQFVKNSTSPGTTDQLGKILFIGDDDGGNPTVYAYMTAKSPNVTDTAEDGYLEVYTMADGTSTLTQTWKAGNVGIGTTSPDEQLELIAGVPTIRLESNVAASGRDSLIEFAVADGDAGVRMSMGIDDSIAEDPLIFSTTADLGTPRMAILNNGNVGIGTASPGQELEVDDGAGGGNIYVTEGIYIDVNNGDNQIRGSSTGAGSAALYIGNQQITTSSDIRLKENITDTTINANEMLSKLRVVDFNWNDPSDTSYNNRNARGRWTGLIAQEAIEHVPFVVNAPRTRYKEIDYNSNSTWMLEYQHLVPVLVKAIQELKSEKDSEIEQLKSQNNALKRRIESLEAKQL